LQNVSANATRHLLHFVDTKDLSGEPEMSQISARLSDDLIAALDEAHCTRADVIRQAVEDYLDDFEDISRAVEVLHDPADPVLDWETAKHELLRQH
jgi:predicted DNA-binding protein